MRLVVSSSGIGEGEDTYALFGKARSHPFKEFEKS
jgi:hypothetical protein